MSTIDSILEKIDLLVDDQYHETSSYNIFKCLFNYYTSSNVVDDFQKGVKLLDTTFLTDNYQWLLFMGFQSVIINDLYNDEHRDKLCRFWLPIYEYMLKELLLTQTTKAQDEDTDRLPLNAIKYLILNMIQMQQTSESTAHILKIFTQFQNFQQKDEYLSIIKILLPLLINSYILQGIEKDNLTNIKLKYRPNELSNTTNVTSTFIMWIILKLTVMFIQTDGDCLTIIKHDQNIKHILLQSIKQINENLTIKVSLCATLALIINEQDIENEINGSEQILTTLIDSIKQGINIEREDYHISTNGMYLIDLMVALKAFLQHDQIKNTFIENAGLELLMELSEVLSETSFDLNDTDDFQANRKSKSALEYDPEASKSYAVMEENLANDTIQLSKEIELLTLECLFVMSFNKDAAQLIKKNEEFMSRLRKLAEENNITPTKSERLKKAVDSILWKLENEDQFKKQQNATMTEQNNDFDIMISYSWDDKPLVHRIYKYLTEQFNYRIWIDQNQMVGSLTQTMAQAVEKSKYVLMCMSETYKGNENCRNEAEYAYDRKKTIIPLIMKNVERDGWIGFISDENMSIDFARQDFKKAIHLLNTQIERNQREKGENIQSIKPKEQNSFVDGPIEEATDVLVRPSIIYDAYKELPIESWSEEHVQNFLYDNKLDQMILLTENINGEELYLLVKKCRREQDWWIMFDRLNQELEKRHQQTLQVSVYLKFLNQIQKYTNSSIF